tara:strand:- start:238 stop:1185 length:948 start_codon:yes stop_codon:yes gene_type:complete
MKRKIYIPFLLFGIFSISGLSYSQEQNTSEEDNASVYLEEYSDEFQEKFFEALKQKGIENYDKAINLFLDCKKLDPETKAIDHELAKVYLETKQFELAQDYAINAVNSDPENFWYLQNLVAILSSKQSGISEVASKIPSDNILLKQNLALVYYQMENYQSAIQVLNTLKNSEFTENLNSKLKMGLKEQEENTETVTFSATVTSDSSSNDVGTITGYKNSIEHIIRSKNYLILDSVSKDALDNYPAQPYFYYARGLALNTKKRYREAASVLEESLDYMLDDISLANKIYQELSTAYTGLNNTVKANIYLRKIKPGF